LTQGERDFYHGLLDRFQYGYDRDGNPLYKKNTIQASASELYHGNSAASGDNNSAYDKLNRLTEFRRGTLTTSSNNGSGLDTVTTGNLSSLSGKTRTWTLDALGNWDQNSTDGSSLTRTNNSGNQVLDLGAGQDVTYDHNGNLTSFDASINPYDNRLTYDAWNRAVSWQGDTFGESVDTTRHVDMAYDALGRRLMHYFEEVLPEFTEEVGLIMETITYDTDFYYSTAWQVVHEVMHGVVTDRWTEITYDEEENPIETPMSDVGQDTIQPTQYVWGLTYIDDLVLRDHDTDGDTETGDLGVTDSGLDERFYAQHDANHNVTSIMNESGSIQQRFVYDPYGTVTALAENWSSGSSLTSYGWNYLHQGTRYESDLGLYDVRNRFYSPTLGRWMQEDPAGYHAAINLYDYCYESPVVNVDPAGLEPPHPNGLDDGMGNAVWDVEGSIYNHKLSAEMWSFFRGHLRSSNIYVAQGGMQVHTTTALTFNVCAPTNTLVDQFADRLYDELTYFRSFQPNNTVATPGPNGIPEYIRFELLGANGTLSSFVNDQPFFVKLTRYPDRRTNYAVTLDSHPLVGVREFSVAVSKSWIPSVYAVTISTYGVEYDRPYIMGGFHIPVNAWGRAGPGGQAQLDVWDNYFKNVQKKFQADPIVIGSALTPSAAKGGMTYGNPLLVHIPQAWGGSAK
jgi:RHS repeat-associated protein